jgi:hypothetical protein
MSLSHRLYELCELLQDKKVAAQTKNPLNTLTLADFIIAVTFVARCQRKVSRSTGRPSKSIELDNRELHDLYTHAYAVFDDWPHNFFQFLYGRSKRWAKLQPNDGKLDTALKKEFGLLYQSLYQDLEGNQFDFLRKAFCEFLTDRMHSQFTSFVEDSSACEMTNCAQYSALADARRSLKITNAALFDLIAAGEIPCRVINSRRTPELAVNAAHVERVKHEFEESMTCRDLAKELGTDCKTIRKLVQDGLIESRVRSSTEAFNVLRFHRSIVKTFIRTLG